MRTTLFLLVLLVLASAQEYSFPDDFAFGSASSAYQVEGAWNEDGKGESIWDKGLHEDPNRVVDGNIGDVACDSYHKYKEDIQLMKDLGVDFYRFSIAWSRVLPNGTNDTINTAGIDYYNNVIDELLANDIQPYITMYHWDLPQAIQDQSGGWPNRTVADLFVDYARLLFDNFGDRVKMWMTFNEIMQICETGYGGGDFAPFTSNPGIDDYQCTHTILLAHGRTYRLYESEYKAKQNGQIGVAIDTAWYEPNDPDSEDDQRAAELGMQINYGWFASPIVTGNYPQVMIDRIEDLSAQEGFEASRLPEFTVNEQQMMKGTFDFIGLNHYSTDLAYMAPPNYYGSNPSHWKDVGIITFQSDSWPGSASEWLKVVPWGIRKNLVWIKEHYNNPPVLITENGYSDIGQLDDYDRADYYKGYLAEILKAIHEEECNVIGYTAWSLMDNFEWLQGYSQRFGLFHVDFNDPGLPRTAKLSAYVYQNIVATRKVDMDYYPDWPPAKM